MWKKEKTQVDPCVLKMDNNFLRYCLLTSLLLCVFYIFFYFTVVAIVCDAAHIYSQVFCMSLLDKMRRCHSLAVNIHLKRKIKTNEQTNEPIHYEKASGTNFRCTTPSDFVLTMNADIITWFPIFLYEK